LTIAAFDGRMLNVHPAPLPEFGGQGMYGMELVDLRDGSSNVSSGSGTAAAYASLGDG
jgi:folate-dependent phosphoribosylglycinamide formyltransferase PurN